MKNKIILIVVLCLILFLFIFNLKNKNKIKTHKILKIEQADSFYIDLNDNNKIEDNELIKLSGINSFYPITPPKIDDICNNLEIERSEYLMLGFFAEHYAQDNFLNKNVEVRKINQNLNYKTAKIYLDGVDIAEILLKSGLAYLDKNNKIFSYVQYQDKKQISANISELKKLDFVIVNLKNNMVHNLSCKTISKIKHAQIFLKNDIQLKKINYCHFCFNDNYKKSNFTDFNIFYDIPKNKFEYKKSIFKSEKNILIFLINPYEFNKPSNFSRTNFAKKLISQINNSKKSIHFALYSFAFQDEIFNALKNAKKRGVEISCVTNKEENPDYKSYNEKVLKEFDCKVNNSNHLMHNKFFIFDDSSIMSGSVNISPTGSGGYNSNIAIFINSGQISKLYLEEFNQMFNNKFSKKKKEVFNENGNSEINVYFSPKNNVRKIILDNIKNSKEEILFNVFYLTDKQIINELISAKKRGVRVIGIIDSLSATNFQDRLKMLRNGKVLIKVENWGGKAHEKTILVDKHILITGSCNFSKAGFEKNDENVIVLDNKVLGDFYRDYFLYLFNEIDNKYLKFIPRSESFNSINSCYDGIDNNFDGKIDFDDDGCKNK